MVLVRVPAPADDQKPPEAPIAMRLRWIREVAEMGPDALELFERQTFQHSGTARASSPCGVRSTRDAASSPAKILNASKDRSAVGYG